MAELTTSAGSSQLIILGDFEEYAFTIFSQHSRLNTIENIY